MRTRKNAIHLTPAERDSFLGAVLTLKNTIANPGDPVSQQTSIYDQFVALHFYVFSINVPGEAFPVNVGHQNAGFGPWHRYYLLRFEQALQAVDPSVSLPYWDWTDHVGTQNVLFQDDFLGPNGGPGGAGGGQVQSGYFAFDAPAVLPAFWPVGLPGWRIHPSLEEGRGTTLRRNLGGFGALPTQTNVNTLLGKLDYEGAGLFRETLEQSPLHNFIHNWVGGHMSGGASPNDLIFFMHHANVDRLWAMWQIDNHQGAAFYPAAGEPKSHNLNDVMWPWVDGAAGYSPNNVLPNIVIQDFSAEPAQTPANVLNHHALGHAYDTEPVVGLALDQTGSMAGMTPDPLTGMPPNISKWQAAKQGVSFFLQDCEAAYAAREAYVTAGVETFRTSGGNLFTQVFGGAHFGVIRNATSFSRATFDANVAALAPSGGTPLAGALSDTETNLVRAPFGNQPPNHQRYLAILTDGIETASPLLSTLAAGGFADTVILAMGFGIGGGWDGVDYGTLATVVSKGKTDPNLLSQVFHGENAAVIDKFYTISLATSIGYTPAVDPRFDLFPGEFIHLNFDITDAEQSFLITTQGFDFDERNWEFCLMGPDGEHCCDTRPGAEHVHAPLSAAGHHSLPEDCPYFLTLRKQDGRFTVFVNRNGADTGDWAGRWGLMVFYRSGTGKPVMIMPSIHDLLVPTGSLPVRGPVYQRFNQPVAVRTPPRLIPGTPPHNLALSLPGLSTRPTADPCALSVNIYHKTTLRPRLKLNARAHFAGSDIEAVLSFDASPSARISDVVLAGRLIAPDFSTGNAFADLRTIPVVSRSRYIDAVPDPSQGEPKCGFAKTPGPLDNVVGQVVFVLPDGTEYRQALGNPTEGERHVTPEGCRWIAVREGIPGGKVVTTPFTIHWKLQPPATFPFNELQYLADYERAKPGAFTVRDERVVFKALNNGAFVATIAGNTRPGIYRVALHIDGIIEHGAAADKPCCEPGPQRFSRVVEAEIALGILPDAKNSTPVLYWTAPGRFVVSVTPTDALGNVASPARAAAPAVSVFNKPVQGLFDNPYTGELRVEFALSGDRVRPNADGQSLAAPGAIVDLSGQRQIELAANKALQVAVRVGAATMPVSLPAFVGDSRNHRFSPAGSDQAIRIPLDQRVPFASDKAARDAGFTG